LGLVSPHLDRADISGCTITIDAMGTQTAMAAKIIEKEANYVLALKANHPAVELDRGDLIYYHPCQAPQKLYQQVKEKFEQARADNFALLDC